MGENAFQVFCNHSPPPRRSNSFSSHTLVLDCYPKKGATPNVRLQPSALLGPQFQLPIRHADLLEIAAYIYCADRRASRGESDALYLDAWKREFHFTIGVRDYKFWSRKDVQESLCRCLEFLSGDLGYKFTFRPNFQPTGQLELLHNEPFIVTPDHDYRVLLFSGGLDSLAGAIEECSVQSRSVVLVSHVSGRPILRNILSNLYDRLAEKFVGQINRYPFDCGLRGEKRIEETQRTRSFLFSAIGFTVAKHLSRDAFHIYENGITSLNWTRDKSLANSRTSRTTHPRAIALLEEFLSHVDGAPFKIKTDFFLKTKTDIYSLIAKRNLGELIRHTVSCSRGVKAGMRGVTHCGLCSQCVDRRFASYGCAFPNGHAFDDAGLYETDFITNAIPTKPEEGLATIYEFLRLAKLFHGSSPEALLSQMSPQFAELTGYLQGIREIDEIQTIYGLCSRHGQNVVDATNAMRKVHESPYNTVTPGSLLDILSKKPYL